MTPIEKIKKELLLANYWETHKFSQDLARFLEIEHPKRKKIEETLNDLSNKLQDFSTEAL